MNSNYYRTLGIEPGANKDEIKKAYRKLAQKYHPDRPGGDSKKFQEIKEAYEKLSNPEKYQQQEPSFTWNHANFGDVEDLVRDFFNNRYNRKPQRQVVTIAITLEEAYTGKEVSIGNTKMNLAPGVHDSNVYLDDTVCRIVVQKHPRFERIDDNLFIDAHISVFEALTGIELQVQHLDGKVYSVKVPAGTQPNQMIRIPGKGMPHGRFVTSGDLFIRCIVEVPDNLTEEQKTVIISTFNARKSTKI